MTTQRELFIAWFDYAASSAPSPEQRAQAIEYMRSIVAIAQNEPPLGQADGSFTNSEWHAALRVLETLERLYTEVPALMRCIKRTNTVSDLLMLPVEDDLPF